MTVFDDLEEIKEIISLNKSLKYKATLLFNLDTIEEHLQALNVIKKFIWVENDKLKCGRFGDIEIELDEFDFESKEQYESIKEILKK